jgi:hypothetical protein
LITPKRLLTREQDQFVRDNCSALSQADLTAALNNKFGTTIKLSQIDSYISNNGINSGRTGHFEKCHKPWNHGTKGQGLTGRNVTSFKKGNIPHTKRKLWSERINRDGFIEISIPERNPWTGAPTRFKHKHVWLWEMEHGPVAKGNAVVFVDGNKLHCVVENLMLVTRAELLSMNLHGYKEAPDDLKPSILALAKIEAKAGFRLRPARRGKKANPTPSPLSENQSQANFGGHF